LEIFGKRNALAIRIATTATDADEVTKRASPFPSLALSRFRRYAKQGLAYAVDRYPNEEALLYGVIDDCFAHLLGSRRIRKTPADYEPRIKLNHAIE
jgi:hypothetical protein